MTTGEEIFWRNARGVLRDINMQHLDPAHGAAVNVVRRCLNTRGRPTYHQQTFLETESPALLAYLEGLATSGDATGWRTLRDRIQLHAELLWETDMQPCSRPWLAAIWHVLPEITGLGQVIIDRQAEKSDPAPETVPDAPETNGETAGDGDKGTAGKSGSAGTTAKPRPSPRLVLPVAPVTPTEAEKKVLRLGDDTPADADTNTPEGPEATDGPGGMKGPGGKQ